MKNHLLLIFPLVLLSIIFLPFKSEKNSAPLIIDVTGADAVFQPSLPTGTGFSSDLRSLINDLSSMLVQVKSPDATFWTEIVPISSQTILNTLINNLSSMLIQVSSPDGTFWTEITSVYHTDLGKLLADLPKLYIPLESADSAFESTPFAYPDELIGDILPPVISDVQVDPVTGLVSWDTDEFAISEVDFGSEFGNYPLVMTDPTWVVRHLILPSTGSWNYFLIKSTDRSGNTADYYYPGFSIQGNVKDSSNNPLPGVIVKVSDTLLAVTDTNGDYSLAGVPAGEITLTAYSSGYQFTPGSIDIVVSGNLTDQDFTADAIPIITEGDPVLVTMSEDGSPIPFNLTLHATDPDIGDTLTWSISSTASHGTATASGTGASKAIGYTPTANYNDPDSFVVQVSDGNGGTDTITVNVTIIPVNDPPIITEGDPVPVTMSEDGSPIPFNLTLHATDPDIGDTLTWSISNPANHGIATASGIGASKAIGYTPVANYNDPDSFVVQVSDGNGGTDTITVNVTITPVNDAPTNISISSTSIAENQPVNSIVGSLSATDVDTGDTFIFSFSLTCVSPGADNASFNLNGTNLRTSAIFDYETKPSYAICLRVRDQGGAGLTYDKNFTITVIDTNLAPTGISLSNNAVAENLPSGTTVGTFSSTDNEPPASPFTYNLVGGTGSTDNASFSISGNQLLTAAIFDYEAKNRYSIRMRTADAGGLWFEKVFPIFVTDMNLPPTDLGLSNSSVPGNMPVGTLVGSFTTTDGEPPAAPFTYSLATGGADNAFFTISGDKLLTAAVFNSIAKNNYSILVSTTDHGGASFQKTLPITITANSQKPILVSPCYGTVLITNPPTFDWLDVPSAIKYTLQIGWNASFIHLNKIYTVSNSNLTPPKNLPVNVKLYWRVMVNKKGVPNLWSDSCSFLIASAPSVPTLIKPGNKAPIIINPPFFDWSDSIVPGGAPALDHYQLRVATDPGFYTPVIDQSVNNSNYTPTTSLTPNTKYYWHVMACNILGQCSAWSKVGIFRMAIAPPTLLLPANGSTAARARPVFDWNDPIGATSYIIQISRNDGFTSLVAKITVKASTYMPKFNLPQGTLFWRVLCKGANGPSDWSYPYWSVTIP